MNHTVFVELKFWLLVIFSFIAPIVIYWLLLVKRAISKATVLILGLALILMAGIDVYLLQLLATHAKASPSMLDDAIFLSEVSVALYILPALLAGVGINIVSHVVIRHLVKAEALFEKEQKENR